MSHLFWEMVAMRVDKFLHGPEQLAHTRFQLPEAIFFFHSLHSQEQLALTGFPLSETNFQKSVPQYISYFNPLLEH